MLITGDTFLSNGDGSINAFNYEVKRLVSFGPDPIGSLDPVQLAKYYLVSKEVGLNHEVPLGPCPIGNPRTPQPRNLGSSLTKEGLDHLK